MIVPEALTASYHRTAWGRAWLAALPVVRADGTPAVLKLQPVTEDNAAAPVGLRTWDGAGAVRLLADEPGTVLPERLDASRPLSSVADDVVALRIGPDQAGGGLPRGRSLPIGSGGAGSRSPG
ncbi:aminoglycoside phosphotransferase family protein [Actinosynnema sp. CA-299493]